MNEQNNNLFYLIIQIQVTSVDHYQFFQKLGLVSHEEADTRVTGWFGLSLLFLNTVENEKISDNNFNNFFSSLECIYYRKLIIF